MYFVQSQRLIHFHHLGQKQLNDLLRLTKQLNIDCCYLGHQKVKEEDLLVLSSTTKLIDIKNIREQYSNSIFLVLDKNLNGHEINQFNDMGNIFYINEINKPELLSLVDMIFTKRGAEKNKQNRLDVDNEDTLAIISHDLKSPLNAIRLDAQILLRNARKLDDESLKEDVKHLSTRIVKTTDRLAFMLSDLLEGEKKGNILRSLTRTSIDAEKLIDEVVDIVSPIAKRNSIKIKKNIAGKIPPFTADRNKIFQVLLNLMSNALKFSLQHTSVQIGVKSHNDEIHFSVQDSGPGIDPQIENTIYERYSSGSRRGCGSGLGLYICKTIVEAHQGLISHCRGDRGGTIFNFSLPIEMEVAQGDNKKIYLIDDDDDLRDVLSWALNSEGYDVEAFSGPREALDFLSRTSERPAMILSDFHMAQMRAIEFSEKKNLLNLGNVPLLILTASPNEVSSEIDQNCYTSILCKPLDLNALVSTVSDLMKTTCTQSV